MTDLYDDFILFYIKPIVGLYYTLRLYNTVMSRKRSTHEYIMHKGVECIVWTGKRGGSYVIDDHTGKRTYVQNRLQESTPECVSLQKQKHLPPKDRFDLITYDKTLVIPLLSTVKQGLAEIETHLFNHELGTNANTVYVVINDPQPDIFNSLIEALKLKLQVHSTNLTVSVENDSKIVISCNSDYE